MPLTKIFLVAALIAMLSGCLDEPPALQAPLPASEAALARERTVRVGGVDLYLPVLLLLSSTSSVGLTMSRQAADNPHAGYVPMDRLLSDPTFPQSAASPVAYVEVSLGSLRMLRDYASDAHASTIRVCPHLIRSWAREICESGLIDGRRVFYPDRFTLIDEQYLIAQRPGLAAYAGGWRSVGEAARASIPTPDSDAPVANCQTNAAGEKNSLCTVVARLVPNLLVVWSTNRSHAEQAHELEAQAVRLRCLIGRGMDASASDATLCMGPPDASEIDVGHRAEPG
ncbi:hypothetical protein [Lysobacter sp. CA199]|uniref:hypothetical protein n=1 Tax=Lysobacter sp. CA199 TaxID=3455608 RepID=UPI003F8D5B4C